MFASKFSRVAKMVQLHQLRPSRQLPLSLMMQRVQSYATITVKVPQMAESISEGTLRQFSKQIGDYVEADEEIATIETDKIDVAVNAPQSGTITELLVGEEDTVTVDQDIIRIDTDGTAPAGGAAPAKESAQVEKETTSGASATAPAPTASAPSAPATSTSTDHAPKKAESSKGSVPPPTSASVGDRSERRVKMNRMLLRMSERLKQSQNTTASLTTFNEVDMSSLIEFRKSMKDEVLKKTGTKFGFMGSFAYACALAMKEFPVINSSIEGEGTGDTIVFHDYVDISVAVATEQGLVTPVIRNIEKMSILEIERGIAEVGKKARDRKLTIEDLAGGTFAISNGGVFGSKLSTPIINHPQSAILGLHAIKERAHVVNGEIKIRPIMELALSYDHRVITGREAVLFLELVRKYIEDPRRMLLEV
ncbi:putative dihydrolipoyllysine-residue succinyltransferase [Ceratocystis platani]|uniref:dihydrolipoyllysine-residue succinyltransferase n=1 Tax=Ceratocystis fimbriata f. sp. platani TaxID=88771 RepID=A0A0F8DD00_CERFI|nr:putative dihydrolipoyllysine-residue succinyltransferase [Ceratocystis platani]